MKLIINTSNLYGGGGVQVGISFLNECLFFNENEYHVFLCPSILNQINIKLFPSNFIFYSFANSPKPTFKGLKVIMNLKNLEKKIKPDCVFTIFGPSYWTPKAPHLMGFAIPHFIYPNSEFFKIISTKERIKWKLLSIIKGYFLKTNSGYYHVESEVVRLRLSSFINCSINNIFTISNTYSNIYNNYKFKEKKILQSNESMSEFRFVCISAFYIHKNLEILNEVIPLLVNNGFTNIKFVLTISTELFEKKFTDIAKKQIVNIGPITVDECPQLYSECNALFLPTLLECFSVSYLEAMVMNLPIITTNLPFAHEICGESALYFQALSANEAFKQIVCLYKNTSLQSELVSNGLRQLKKFENSTQRAKKYLDICNVISKK